MDLKGTRDVSSPMRQKPRARRITTVRSREFAIMMMLLSYRVSAMPTTPEGFYFCAQRYFCWKAASLAGSWSPVRSGEFSENSPYLQGGFEKQKSKKKNADQPRVAV